MTNYNTYHTYLYNSDVLLLLTASFPVVATEI